ncbi:MAG: MarR family transcriptional regulator [Burkholderiaceae bacterium]
MSAGPFDLETRVTDADHTALRLWLRLLTCTNLIEADVRRRLRAGFTSTLPRFDLLAQLERSRDGLRMSELSRRLMVTGGNITALTEQLDAEGWLTREPEPDDRRATRVRLTRRGRERFAAMAGEHERWVRELLSPLDKHEQLTLLDLLGKLKAGIRA